MSSGLEVQVLLAADAPVGSLEIILFLLGEGVENLLQSGLLARVFPDMVLGFESLHEGIDTTVRESFLLLTTED